MLKRRILIEYGAGKLGDGENSPFKSDLAQMAVLGKRMEDEYGIDLRFIPYGGVNTANSGGRYSSISPAQLVQNVGEYNSSGIPFVFALNGGLLSDGPTKLDVYEHMVLEALASNSTNAMKNKVVVTHPDIKDQIKKGYPDLELIASCIQQLNPRFAEPMEEKFKTYDFVVPINQQSTPDCLGPFMQYAEKMILFINFGCANPNLSDCYVHHMGLEVGTAPKSLMARKLELLEKYSDRDYLIRLPKGAVVCDSDCGTVDAELINRPEHLSYFLKNGVNIFKVPRDISIDVSRLDRLCQLASQAYVGMPNPGNSLQYEPKVSPN